MVTLYLKTSGLFLKLGDFFLKLAKFMNQKAREELESKYE